LTTLSAAGRRRIRALLAHQHDRQAERDGAAHDHRVADLRVKIFAVGATRFAAS
jgi:hypothetical protein